MTRDAATPGGGAPALVGLGSPHGDDQIGWVAVDRLRPRLPTGVVAAKASGGLDLLGLLAGQDELIVVDAAAPAGRPGAIRSFAWPSREFEGRVAWSTHGLGLVEALRLAEALGRLPRRVQIETVEARDGSPGSALSDDAARGIDDLVESVLMRLLRRDGAAPEEVRCTRPR